MEAGERVKRIRSALGVTQQEFGEFFGFKWSKIRDIESGKQKVTPEFAQAIEKKFSYRFTWILFGQGEMREGGGLETPPPVLGDTGAQMGVHALAGREHPYELFSGPPIEHITLSDRYLDDVHLVKMQGQSMEPLIYDGAILGVDYDDRAIVSGKIYAVWTYTEGAVIRKAFSNFDTIEFKSENESFPDFSINGKVIDLKKVILGRVKWVLQLM